MKRGVLIVATIGGAALLAAFVALFVAISFGTFNLDPDSAPGSRIGDVAAIGAGGLIFAMTIFAAQRRGLFTTRGRPVLPRGDG